MCEIRYGNPLFLPASNLPATLSSYLQVYALVTFRPITLSSIYAIIEPSPYAVLTFDTIFRNQSNQLSSNFIILWFSVTFWIRVVKQLVLSRVVSKSVVERSTCMDKTRVFFLTISCCCFFIPRGETNLDKPLIKGTPRYNEVECILRRTYSEWICFR